MALIDEDKLQGHLYEILQILRRQPTCCSVVSAQWMTDANSNDVWVLTAASGEVIIKDSPTGEVQVNPALPLSP